MNTESLGVTRRVHEEINRKNSQNEQKISFLVQFRPFLNNSIKTIAYLIHRFASLHWSKFQTKLTTF